MNMFTDYKNILLHEFFQVSASTHNDLNLYSILKFIIRRQFSIILFMHIFSNCPTQINTPQDVGQVLGLTALNIKTIQLTKKYLEHIGKEGFYISGFVDGSEKLDEFLKSFRIMTGSAFSIRRSKAKINDDPEPEEKPLRKYKPGYLGKGMSVVM